MERLALPNDKQELKALWALCFDDSDSFIDFYFDHRFLPDYSAVYEEAGKIVGCAYAYPVHAFIRGRILPCVLLAGVATHPDYRRRGISHKILHLLEEKLRDDGILLIIHRPAILETYFSIGHFPVSSSKYLRLDQLHEVPECDQCFDIDIKGQTAALFACYARYARRYSLMISRSCADFSLKMTDYLSDYAKCISTMKDGKINGYCIYYESEDAITGEEFVADDNDTYTLLYEGMKKRSAGKELLLRMASDSCPDAPDAKVELVPRCVLGVCNVEALLQALYPSLRKDATFAVTDEFLKQNEGIFTLSGERSGHQPQLKIQAGRLLQWIVGNKTMAELASEKNAEILDPQIVAQMDDIGKCACYVIDEY